ncbi:MAG: MotA/TolQ/ExbB proton channel family protein [Nitrospira sp.]|nr:MotA/TolQ/ExbB proton channel family protein [Nitrospira sp.]HBP89750.1 Tol-Pal system subunit TolQ [Nitrospiraceae bacterium]HNP30183.1 MotA/TolQ/ExbB proton channel family protein [Nitrospirales bacterium]
MSFAANPSEFFASLGLLSIVILFVLSIFSVISWGIIVNKFRRFGRIRQEESQFLQLYEQNPIDQQSLRRQAQTLAYSPSSAVYLGITDRLPESSDLFTSSGPPLEAKPIEHSPNRQYLEKVAQYIIQNQISQQESYLPFLATTGNLSPFIGLLGTVLGIINAFREIGVQGSASIAAVAPGVSEALVATAAGLFAAIPAVMAYNYFLSRIRKMSFRVEAFTIEFLNTIEESEKAFEVEVTR